MSKVARGGNAKDPSAPGNVVKPILDLTTRKEYRSEYQAGKALYSLVGGRKDDTRIWFKIAKAHPDRFQTKNLDGEWVALNDPSVPKGSTKRGS